MAKSSEASGEVMDERGGAAHRSSRGGPGRWIRRVHRRVSGRYRWALLAGVIAGVSAAGAGWYFQSPTYRTTATLALVLDETAAPPPDAGDRLHELGAIARRSGATGAGPAAGAIRVDPALGLIELTIDDADASLAAGRARQLAGVLVAAHGSVRDAMRADHDAVVRDRLRLLADRDAARARIDELEAAAGADPIEPAYQRKLAEAETISASLTRAELAIAEAGVGGGVAPRDEADLTLLADTDRKLASLMLTRRDVERRLASLRERMGESAPAVISERENLAAADRQIAAHLDEVRNGSADLLESLTVGGARRADPTALAARRENLATLLDRARTELAAITTRRDQIESARRQLGVAESDLAEIERREDELAAAMARHGTLTAAGTIEPAVPWGDPRPRNAAIGAAAGFLSAFALAVMLLACDRRMLHPAAESFGDIAPLLGAVPAISPNQSDPRDADLTALSIHHIRALLEVRASANAERAFAITSPSVGSGKTSLTVGLASSLALSGTRTLLVDCELASRAVRRGEGEERSAEQSLDEVMVQMGYLDPREADLFVFGDDAGIGLLGMLAGKPLEACVVRSAVDGLSILPALATDAHHIGKMSGRFIRRIIDEATGRYDMILFDTGSIPGSIEALLVASEVDGVVVVASRGESQSRYNKTLAALDMVRARVVGTVFNRADREDLTVTSGRPRRGKRGKRKPEPMPFGAKATRRLPPPPGMGSGILAAAVHAQAQSTIKPQDGLRAVDAPGVAQPAPKPKRPGPPPAPGRADRPADMTVADAGDIAAILDEAATIAEHSSDKDLTEESLERMLESKTDPAQRAAHATPKDEQGNPAPPQHPRRFDPDDDIASAIDELLSDAGAAAGHDAGPQIHVEPTAPTRRRG